MIQIETPGPKLNPSFDLSFEECLALRQHAHYLVNHVRLEQIRKETQEFFIEPFAINDNSCEIH